MACENDAQPWESDAILGWNIEFVLLMADLFGTIRSQGRAICRNHFGRLHIAQLGEMISPTQSS